MWVPISFTSGFLLGVPLGVFLFSQLWPAEWRDVFRKVHHTLIHYAEKLSKQWICLCLRVVSIF